MIYQDSIYGIVNIDEPVLHDLLASKAMQRLKGILQHGITGLIGITQPITRFDHSMGAMLLVRRLGGGLEEQIAALLHDVSHTAFSHVIDYAVDGHDDQSYHDEMKESYVSQTDLPAILRRHGYDWTNFIHEDAYPLLEQPAPHLCADRLDYFLRDCQGLGLAEKNEIDEVLNHLVVVNGRIATRSHQSANWLGRTYIQCDDTSWANFREVGLYEVTAQAIRRGLQIKAISEEDFWLTDDPFWRKLHAAEDAELQSWLQLVTPQTRFVWDEANPTFRISTKLRAIDPDVLVDGRLYPLSVLDTDFAQYRIAYLKRKQGKWPMRVVPKPED